MSGDRHTDNAGVAGRKGRKTAVIQWPDTCAWRKLGRLPFRRFLQFGTVLRYGQRVNREDLGLVMELKVESIRQQILEHELELFLRSAGRDRGNEVEALRIRP